VICWGVKNRGGGNAVAEYCGSPTVLEEPGMINELRPALLLELLAIELEMGEVIM